MDLSLNIHNIGALISGLISLGLAIFIFLNNPRKIVNLTLAFTNLAVSIFCFSHLIGTNISDPVISRNVLMLNVSIIFITVFVFHSIFATLRKNVGFNEYLIAAIYGAGIGLAIFYIAFPDTFLLPSEPKMYFPNYYVPGSMHMAMRAIFNGLIPLYLFASVILTLFKTKDFEVRNRIIHLIPILVIGYVIGFIPVLLVYNIKVDPSWGIWFVPLYAIPMVYAIIAHELVNIKIVAKKAVLYGLSVAGMTTVIMLLVLLSQAIYTNYPEFPAWILPLVASILTVTIGVIVWKRMREVDLLKYEFITTVTHKFRTPLTQTKWAAEMLKSASLSDEYKEPLKYIEEANEKLVELTNVLVRASENDSATSDKSTRNDLSKMAEDAFQYISSQFPSKKSVRISKEFAPDTMVNCDQSRVRFVLQTMIENAFDFTPPNGSIVLRVFQDKGQAKFEVTDSGIGIKAEDISNIFTRFYRGHEARLVDTEGMGIGLFVSKRIIDRYNGQIWTRSKGLDQGSTFGFSLKLTN